MLGREVQQGFIRQVIEQYYVSLGQQPAALPSDEIGVPGAGADQVHLAHE
jgi:hypothetical protein